MASLGYPHVARHALQVIRDVEAQADRLGVRDLADWARGMDRSVAGAVQSLQQGPQLGVAFVPALVGAGLVTAAAIGAWIRGALTDANRAKAYLECVERARSIGLTDVEADKRCADAGAINWANVGLFALGLTLAATIAFSLLRRQ